MVSPMANINVTNAFCITGKDPTVLENDDDIPPRPVVLEMARSAAKVVQTGARRVNLDSALERIVSLLEAALIEFDMSSWWNAFVVDLAVVDTPGIMPLLS
jgi:hypothetical protein